MGIERKYYIQWQKPTENAALARLGQKSKVVQPVPLKGIDAEMNRLLEEAREGKIGTRDFWIRRNRVLKGGLL